MADDPGASPADPGPSPFHAGEHAVQARVGVREKVDSFGRIGVRRFMPEQHRTFFAQLPLFFIAAQDDARRPWASCLVGEPGFLRAPEETLLYVGAWPGYGDPLARGLSSGAAVGGLGIELPTRRRNRVNGIVERDGDRRGFWLRVRQSFGNCPQYIQARAPRFVRPPSEQGAPRSVRYSRHLDSVSADIVRRADTFFIATRSPEPGDDAPGEGFDVSHRGGPTGFVRILEGGRLVWPDYRGNFFFNTLGNLELDPTSGLLFIDFDTGDTVQLTGRAEVLWDWDRDDPAYAGAQRLVTFEVDACIHIGGALPLAWDFLSAAPQFQAG